MIDGHISQQHQLALSRLAKNVSYNHNQYPGWTSIEFVQYNFQMDWGTWLGIFA
jgi:hypothetical protein